jgi:hypothetical protein
MWLSVEQLMMAFTTLRNNFHTAKDKDSLCSISVTCCPASLVRAENSKGTLFIQTFVPLFHYLRYHSIILAIFPPASS